MAEIVNTNRVKDKNIPRENRQSLRRIGTKMRAEDPCSSPTSC
jgi:hypothetical protein